MSKTPSDKFNVFINDLCSHVRELVNSTFTPIADLSKSEQIKDTILQKQKEISEYLQEKLSYVQEHREDKLNWLMEEYGNDFVERTTQYIEELKQALENITSPKQEEENDSTSDIKFKPLMGFPNIPLRDQIYRLAKKTNWELTRDIEAFTKLYNDVKTHTSWRGKSNYPGDADTTLKDFLECLYPYNLLCIPPNMPRILNSLDKNTNLFSLINELNYLAQHPEYVPQPSQKQVLGRMFKLVKDTEEDHICDLLKDTINTIFSSEDKSIKDKFTDVKNNLLTDAYYKLGFTEQAHKQIRHCSGIAVRQYIEKNATDTLHSLVDELKNYIFITKYNYTYPTLNEYCCSCLITGFIKRDPKAIQVLQLFPPDTPCKLIIDIISEEIKKVSDAYDLDIVPSLFPTKEEALYCIDVLNSYYNNPTRTLDSLHLLIPVKEITILKDHLSRHIRIKDICDVLKEYVSSLESKEEQTTLLNKATNMIQRVDEIVKTADERITKAGLPKTESTVIEQIVKEFEQDLKVDNSKSPLLQYIKIPDTIKAIEKVTDLPITHQYDLYKTCGEMDGYLLQWTYTKATNNNEPYVSLRVILKDYPGGIIPDHLRDKVSFCAVLTPPKTTDLYKHEYEPQVYALNKQNNFSVKFHFGYFEHYVSDIKFAYLK